MTTRLGKEGARWDVIVVGSGAAGLAAACKAALDGASVLVLEQSDLIGGTTAISGGMVWIPANKKAALIGKPDTLEAARTYLEATVPSADWQRLNVFLSWGDEVIRDLEAHTILRFQPVPTYPDYYPDLPGATSGGRVLEPVPFDGTQLGKDFFRLRDPLPEFMLFGGMMVSRSDIPHFRSAWRSPRSFARVTRLVLDYARQRVRARRGTTLYLGNALAARLLKSALDLGITFRTGQSVETLRTAEGGRITGVVVREPSGQNTDFVADRAVILATGGVSHDVELRRRYVPSSAGILSATVRPDEAPCGARLAIGVGAALSPPTENGAFWVPGSIFTRRDGTSAVYPHTVTDRAKPGAIAVGSDGKRFVNEAVSYHEFVRAQFEAADRAIPAWLIGDSNFIWRYGMGKVKPFTTRVPADDYLRKGDTIKQLACAIGVPEAALAATVEAFNHGARRGEDLEFGRGSNIYQRHLGDVYVKPNPCVAPLETRPFYAIALYPADLGIAGGIMTDPQTHVLREDGSVIPSLFACGNDMASVMEGAYPGPGITLGPALTFGWLAGRQAAASLQVA